MSGAREDVVPERFTKEPMPQHVDYQTNVGATLPINEMLPKYYKYRDYEPGTGFPSERKLKQLGLDYVAEDIRPLRKRYMSESEQKKKKYYY
jgi:aldehyde:ferredoxin oxidoreductase